MRTTIISVTHNSARVVQDMIASVPEEAPLIVVDNASQDATTEIIAQNPRVQFIDAPKNEGFGRACNRGAGQAETEFLVFLNPDARLMPKALDALESAADQNPSMGAANPILYNGKGQARLKTTSPLRLPACPLPRLDRLSEMPVLMGSAFFVRRRAFEAIGGFDPAIFLYHEDHDLSLRLRQAGWTLWHVPQAQAQHIAGTGSARSPETAWFKGYHMARSRYYLINKASPGHGFRRSFWPAFWGLLLPHTLLSRRRRFKALGQLQGALSARQDGGKFV